jgi:hypothetical protein
MISSCSLRCETSGTYTDPRHLFSCRPSRRDMRRAYFRRIPPVALQRVGKNCSHLHAIAIPSIGLRSLLGLFGHTRAKHRIVVEPLNSGCQAGTNSNLACPGIRTTMLHGHNHAVRSRAQRFRRAQGSDSSDSAHENYVFPLGYRESSLPLTLPFLHTHFYTYIEDIVFESK